MPEPQEVKDRPAENGIKINNILTALILTSILWVATSIEDIKASLFEVATSQRVDGNRIDSLETRVSRTESIIDEKVLGRPYP